MPQRIGQHNWVVAQGETGKPILVAQGEGHETTGGETHETVGKEHHEGGHNLLAEHPAGYYSGVAFLVASAILIFCKVRMGSLTTRNPGRGQLLIEQGVASMRHFCRNAIGAEGDKFTAFVGTIFALVLCSNLCGVLPLYWNKMEGMAGSFTPAPSANLSLTLALGFIVFLVFNFVGIKANGAKAYFGHFAGPIPALAPLIFPIELIGIFVRPISLGMRLFGNIFGEETVIAVLIGMAAATWVIPLQFPMMAFGVFGAVVQAGVFAILTCSYIALAIGEHDHGDHGHAADGHGHAAEAAH